MKTRLATKLRFYFDRSLTGYFIRRAKAKWFTSPPKMPSQFDYRGVTLQLAGLSPGMQNVLVTGNYEVPEMKLLPGFLTSSDQVLEVGGAIGFLGLYCLKQVGIKKCTTVEPNPVTVSYLKRNYELNSLTPTLIQAAISREDGPVSFHVSEMFWTDSLFDSAAQAGTTTVTVEGLSFESLWQRAGGEFNALIIDIEGGEQYIASWKIPAQINKVLIEIHPEMIGVRNAYSVLESLIRSGFSVQGHQYNTWALSRE